MQAGNLFDPYAGNRLCQLGPIPSREDALARLLELPPRPGGMGDVPRHIRVHHLMRLRDLHIPSEMEVRLAESIDLMLRDGYRYRDPDVPSTFAMINGESLRRKRPAPPAIGAAVGGVSGTGKTEGSLRCLSCYPQTIFHESFPGIVESHQQVVWQSVEVPASGKAEDLARALMFAWTKTTGSGRFTGLLAKDKFRNPMQALDEWRHVASAHFLGILHLDEVQNFFKINTLEQRRKRKASDGPAELSIVEDQCLRWILSLLNSWGIPVLFSGTPDGVGAFTKRLSTAERIVVGGAHQFDPFSTWNEPAFKKHFLGQLRHYQYTKVKLTFNDAVAELIHHLTAGVPRIIIALWIGANRLALEDAKDALTVEHLRQASEAYLAPLSPAVSALLSQDPLRLARYEDLVTRDPTFWPSFWESMSKS